MVPSGRRSSCNNDGEDHGQHQLQELHVRETEMREGGQRRAALACIRLLHDLHVLAIREDGILTRGSLSKSSPTRRAGFSLCPFCPGPRSSGSDQDSSGCSCSTAGRSGSSGRCRESSARGRSDPEATSERRVLHDNEVLSAMLGVASAQLGARSSRIRQEG